MSAPMIDVGDLIEFIDELRLAGYDISTQQYIGAQNLLLALAANGHLPSDPRALQTWLAPVLCSSPREQNNFYRRFDRWISQHPRFAHVKAATKGENKAQAISEEAERRAWRGTLLQPKYLVPLLAVLVIVAGLVFLPPLIPRTLTGQVVDDDSKQPVANAKISLGEKTAVSDNSGGFSISYRSKQLPDTLTAGYPEYETATLTIDANSKSPVLLNLQQVAPPSDDTPAPTPIPGPSLPVSPVIAADPQPTITPMPAVAGNTLKWVRYGGAIFPFFVFGMWLLWEKKLSRALLKKLQSASQPHLDRIVVKGAAGQLFLGQSFRRTIQELRRHRQRGARELDAPGTVHRTIQKGGLFSPFYGSRQTLPEYLVLIDRASFQDQQARLEEELIRRLVQENVFVDFYYFQGDPRTCRTPGKDSRFVTLQEMAALHPDHHLIIFSDGSTFLNPVTGAPESWLEMFSPWDKRALLTPEPASQCGYREWVLAESDFMVLPATKEGLAALTELIDGGASPLLDRSQRARPFPPMLRERPRRWLDNHEPAPEVANQLCDQLKLFLGSKGYFWLSACAIYPILYWDLTLYLGFKLFSDRSEIEDRLLSLVRLPWFRYGTLPDWLRSKLSSELSAEDNLRIRRILEELFLTVLQQPADGIRLDIASGKGQSRLKRWITSWKFKRFLRQALKEEPPESPLRDYVFLAFMSGRKPHKLTVSVPNSIRRVFFPQGQFALGLRPLSALVIAAILSASMFFLAPTQAGPADEGGANTLAGQLVVTASVDSTARVWDAATGMSLIVLRGHTNFVHSAAFSPDGKSIVTAGADYTARVWDAATGETVLVLSGHTDSVYSAVFSPDGQYIVTASADGTARIWDVATGRSDRVISGQAGSVTSAVFSPDGQYIVTASADGTARIWDVGSGQTVMIFKGHGDLVESAVFSPDGKYIVTASRDKTARVWEIATGREMSDLRGPSPFLSAAFSPNGKYIATASRDNTAAVWEAFTWRSVLVLSGHTDTVRSVVFSFDGNYIVTASDDQTARVWDVATRRTMTELRGHAAAVISAAFGPPPGIGTPEPSNIDQQIADLIAKFNTNERHDASRQLEQLYEQNKAAVVKALIDAIQAEGPDSYSVNFYIAYTLRWIRPNWEGTVAQLAKLRALRESKDYQYSTFKESLDEAINNFTSVGSSQTTPTPTPQPSPSPFQLQPVALSANPIRAVVGGIVTFTARVANVGGRSYTINYGDGGAVRVPQPATTTHKYSKAGSYRAFVVTTDLASGLTVTSNSVQVVVTESELGTIPDLRARAQDEVRTILGITRFSLGKVSYQETDRQRPGYVISQQPGPGDRVPKGTPIDILVAKEPVSRVEQSMVAVPSVIGKEYSDAMKILTSAGLEYLVPTNVGGQPSDIVVEQEPKPGTLVPPGTTVKLIVRRK